MIRNKTNHRSKQIRTLTAGTFVFLLIPVLLLSFVPSKQTNAKNLFEGSVPSTAYTDPETGYMAEIYDLTESLSPYEEEQLLANMKRMTGTGHSILLIAPLQSTERDAQDFYLSHYKETSGTMFTNDTQNRYLYICSIGKNKSYINDRKSLTITDNVYRYAKAGNYFECYNEAFHELAETLENGKITKPMAVICNLLLALILSTLVIYFITRAYIMKKKPSMDEILGASICRISMRNTAQTFTNRTKEARSDSSSSSSSDGGSSGGGFSSGGSGGDGGGFSGGGHGY